MLKPLAFVLLPLLQLHLAKRIERCNIEISKTLTKIKIAFTSNVQKDKDTTSLKEILSH
jgi:hypothetical protein